MLAHLSRNRNLHLHPRLNIDNNLLDHLRRRIQIDESLVDSHLKHIPRLGPFAARRLARGHFEGLGGETHGALDAQVLGFGALEEFGAHFFEGLDFARREGDADFVDFLSGC